MHPKRDNPTMWIGFATRKLAGMFPLQGCLSGVLGFSSLTVSNFQRLLEGIIGPAIFPAVGEPVCLCVRLG